MKGWEVRTFSVWFERISLEMLFATVVDLARMTRPDVTLGQCQLIMSAKWWVPIEAMDSEQLRLIGKEWLLCQNREESVVLVPATGMHCSEGQ
jgi:hypothetical protein